MTWERLVGPDGNIAFLNRDGMTLVPAHGIVYEMIGVKFGWIALEEAGAVCHQALLDHAICQTWPMADKAVEWTDRITPFEHLP